MSETGPPKGMQAPNTGTQDAALAKKAQEARGSSKVDEVLAATVPWDRQSVLRYRR